MNKFISKTKKHREKQVKKSSKTQRSMSKFEKLRQERIERENAEKERVTSKSALSTTISHCLRSHYLLHRTFLCLPLPCNESSISSPVRSLSLSLKLSSTLCFSLFLFYFIPMLLSLHCQFLMRAKIPSAQIVKITMSGCLKPFKQLHHLWVACSNRLHFYIQSSNAEML